MCDCVEFEDVGECDFFNVCFVFLGVLFYLNGIVIVVILYLGLLFLFKVFYDM